MELSIDKRTVDILYVDKENLHNFTSFYTGWDPENEIGTGDSPSYYPINRIYSFGLSLNF